MSILGSFAWSILFSPDAIILIVWSAFAIAIAIRTRVFRPSLVAGPRRLEPGQPWAPLIISTGTAAFTYVFVSALCVSLYDRLAPAPTTKPSIVRTEFGAVESAFVYAVPPLAGAIMLLFVDWALGGKALLLSLGLKLRKIPIGLFAGLLGAIIILPMTQIVMIVAEWFYERFQFQHPMEHDLLKVVGESPQHPIAQAILLLSATVIAPLVEEFLFRGHLQTLIRQMLLVVSQHPEAGTPIARFGFPGIQPTTYFPQPAESIPLATIATKPIWQTWVAIFVTSAIFASLHPGWMWPGIFCLSLGMGYCYERIGNLWSNITVHCLFNSSSTLVFLLSSHS